jgi:hypothetical protein
MSIRKHARSSAVLGVVFSLVFTTQAWAAPSAPTKVIGGKLDQIIPAAGGNFVVWTQNRRPGKPTYDAWVRNLPLGGDTPVRLNPGGSRGYTGGINQDNNEAIYEKLTRTSDDLVIVPDLNTPALQEDPPAGINTGRQEAFPTISTNFILFTRASLKRWSVILYDRIGDTFTTLATAPAKCFCLTSGTVSNNFATWTKCGSVSHCNTFYYDPSDSSTHVFPNPTARPIYGGTVSDGTNDMYAVRSGAACGAKVKILRWHFATPATPPVVIASFAAGSDLVTRLFVYNDGTNDTVYFDPASCSTARANIYAVTLADT